MPIYRVSWLFVLAAGCAVGEDNPAIDRASRAIIGGAEIDTDPAVVDITSNGIQWCTGTLISPRVVLTAGHCVYPNFPQPLDVIRVYFGSNVYEPGRTVEVTEEYSSPDFDPDAVPNDFGLVALAEEILDVEPMEFSREPFSLPVGTPIRVIGFGFSDTAEHGGGIKREGAMHTIDSDASTIWALSDPSVPCYGDSGGPALFVRDDGSQVQFGIQSRSDCEYIGMFERVDTHIAEIDAFVAAHPSCGKDTICLDACASLDPDCAPVPSCEGDGVCNADCDEGSDPDCAAPPECERGESGCDDSETTPPTPEAVGCQTGGGACSELAFLILVAGSARARRRRRA